MKTINNQFYDDLKEEWYYREDHPIALLRQENKIRNPWILSVLENYFPGQKLKVLDIGCGGGFLTHELAKKHHVFGVDLSTESLKIAKAFDVTQSINYQKQDAMQLEFEDKQFDAVFAMDLLEHVPHPEKVIQEAKRVLKKGGLFFFHTFNRNWLSYLLIIKGVELFVPHAPKEMHVYSLFIKPKELKEMLKNNNFQIEDLKGFGPKILSYGIVDLLWQKKVTSRFQFQFSSSCLTGYIGFAQAN